MNNNVDNFLLAHKIEVADNGFSDRVMKALPARKTSEARLTSILQCICCVAVLAFCYFSDVLNILIVDFKVFIMTFPEQSAAMQWFYALGLPILVFWAIIGLATRSAYKLQ